VEKSEYQIRHFEMMRDIVERLPEIPVKFLAHYYSYETMGSWWFTFMLGGERFRVVLDGRDDFLRLDRNKADRLRADWEEIDQEPIAKGVDDEIIEAVIKLVKRTCSGLL